jgi:hypothetical protein
MGQDIKELGAILLILVLIIAGVQWFFVRFVHWSVALVVTGLIALFISSLYVSLAHATPNGGSRGPNASEFVTPTLVIFGALLCGLALVCHFSQIRLPKMAFILPFSLIAIFAIGRYVYQYIDNVTLSCELFSKCDIELKNQSDSGVRVREICFQNTQNGLVNIIDPLSKQIPYPSLTRFSNRITFRCFSAKTDRIFSQDFPFDYRLCQEKEGQRLGFCFWLRQKVVLPMKIVLLPNGKVDLYLDSNLISQYQLNDEDLLKKTKTK